MKIKYLGLTFFFLSTLLFSNSLVNDFLQLNAEGLYEESHLKLEDSSLAYFDKVRVESEYREDEEGSRQESVSLRLYPKKFNQYALERENIEHKQNHLNHGMKREKLRLQEQNYKLLVDAKFQKKMVDFLEKSIALYQDELSVKEKMMDGKFYVESIFFMKHKIELLKLKELKERERYKGTLRAIALTFNGKYSIREIAEAVEAYRLIDSATIIERVEGTDFGAIRQSGIDEKLKKERLALLEEEIKLEEMKGEFSLDFIEAGFKNRENRGNSFSLGVGVDLPLKHTNQVNIMNEKLALIEFNQKEKVEDEHYARQIELLLSEAKRLYGYEHGLKELLSHDTFYKLYSKKEDADPRFILEVQEKNLNLEEELLQVEEKLHQLYIKLLTLTHGFNIAKLNPLVSKEL
jgi:hypothetical protein